MCSGRIGTLALREFCPRFSTNYHTVTQTTSSTGGTTAVMPSLTAERLVRPLATGLRDAPSPTRCPSVCQWRRFGGCRLSSGGISHSTARARCLVSPSKRCRGPTIQPRLGGCGMRLAVNERQLRRVDVWRPAGCVDELSVGDCRVLSETIESPLGQPSCVSVSVDR